MFYFQGYRQLRFDASVIGLDCADAPRSTAIVFTLIWLDLLAEEGPRRNTKKIFRHMIEEHISKIAVIRNTNHHQTGTYLVEYSLELGQV